MHSLASGPRLDAPARGWHNCSAMSKWIYVLGAVIVGGFAVLGMMRMIEVQTPYVTLVAQARSITDRPVRFAGSIVRGATVYDDGTDELVFRLRDGAGDTITVRYTGVKPPGFDDATAVVVRGRCYRNDFIATQVVPARSTERPAD